MTLFLFSLFVTFLPRIWGANCPKIQLVETDGISCDLKKEIVKIHNEIRERIAKGLIMNQPPAANMREMYWDEELARNAQKWANHCKFAHSSDADRKISRFDKIGQNIAITRNRSRHPLTKDFRKEINKWLGESIYYSFDALKPESVKKVGHYTQLAWANTHLVGCGYSQFRANNITSRLYVCNYAISGNDFGDLPYISGDQKCSDGFYPSKTYSSLCSIENSLELICESKEKPDDNDLINVDMAARTPESSQGGRKSMIEETSNEFIADDFELVNIKPDVNRSRDGIAITNLRVDKMYNILYF